MSEAMTSTATGRCARMGRAVRGALGVALVLGTGLWAGPSQAGPHDGLPQRNLLVEWRVSGQGRSEQRQAGVEMGRIVIDSRRGVIGRAGISAGTLRTDTEGNTVQQVMVLNGGRARLFVGRTQSVTTWQWAYSPYAAQGGQGTQSTPGNQGGQTTFGSPGVAVVPQTVWIDLGEGLNVTPRWPGGRSPVVVELEARSRQPMQPGAAYGGQLDPDGQTRHSELASTVSVPMGEWTVVARNGGRVQQSQSGTLSTRELDDSQSQQLEIRITAP